MFLQTLTLGDIPQGQSLPKKEDSNLKKNFFFLNNVQDEWFVQLCLLACPDVNFTLKYFFFVRI